MVLVLTFNSVVYVLNYQNILHREHIAPVLCVAAIVNRSLVISCGEDSALIVTSLVDGALVSSFLCFVMLVTDNQKMSFFTHVVILIGYARNVLGFCDC